VTGMPSKPAAFARACTSRLTARGPDALARGDAGPVDPGEQRAGTCRADPEPGVECPDGVGLPVLAAGDSDDLPPAVLVGLRAADRDEDAGGLRHDVGKIEGGELAGTQRGGVAEQNDGAVTRADCGHGVDGRDGLAELIDGEWVCLAPGRGAHDPTQSAADSSYDDVGGRVGQALSVMPVCDGGAIAIEGREAEARFGALGQECGECLGSAGNGWSSRLRHHAFHWRHAEA
jgi:hypothetical protein